VNKYGGIGTFVQSALYKYRFFLDTECEYVQWSKLSKSLLHCYEDDIKDTMYMPPENTLSRTSQDKMLPVCIDFL